MKYKPTYYDERISDPHIPNPLTGYQIASRDDGGAMAYQVGCFEGVRLHTEDAPEAGMIEPDVLFIDYLTVYRPHQGRGLSTEVLRAAFAEAKERGFTMGRGGVINPRVISSLERLTEEGVLADVRFFPIDTEYFPHDSTTSELLEKDGVSPEAAKIWLEEDELGRYYKNAVVDAIFHIAD